MICFKGDALRKHILLARVRQPSDQRRAYDASQAADARNPLWDTPVPGKFNDFLEASPTHALPRMSRQLTGHARGADIHDKTYMKDVEPDDAALHVNRLKVTFPFVAPFNIGQGLEAIKHALQRKDGGRGADEDIGGI